jgi:protein gp37
MFGVSHQSVTDAKLILDHGTEEEKKQLDKPKTPLKPLAKKVRERVQSQPKAPEKPKAKATFNQTNDSIEWAKWSWNPVTGCKHGCPYCYAREIANRYRDAFPKGFEPAFHPDRLEAPKNTKMPTREGDGWRNVFVCSMADLFGDWVPQEWIDRTLDACREAITWDFIFLTKNPKRLVGLDWPANSVIGTTVDCQDRVQPAIEAFEHLQDHTTFLSCEPLNTRLDFGQDGLRLFDYVIIGGQTGPKSAQPEWEWVESLHFEARKAGCKVYWKPNLTVRPKEFFQR